MTSVTHLFSAIKTGVYNSTEKQWIQGPPCLNFSLSLRSAQELFSDGAWAELVWVKHKGCLREMVYKTAELS